LENKSTNTKLALIMKKIVVFFFLCIAISCNKEIPESNNLIDHIPIDAQIVIKINNLEETGNTLRDNKSSTP